jgi:ABC-type transporter Mla MlaB component
MPRIVALHHVSVKQDGAGSNANALMIPANHHRRDESAPLPVSTRMTTQEVAVPDSAVLVLEGRIAPDDIAGLCRRLGALLAEGRTGRVVIDVAGLSDPDVSTVDAVARLQLTAKRAGSSVELRHACERLRELLALVGLTDVVPCAGGSSEPDGPDGPDDPRSVVEALGRPHVGEELVDVEEVVQPDDPVA